MVGVVEDGAERTTLIRNNTCSSEMKSDTDFAGTDSKDPASTACNTDACNTDSNSEAFDWASGELQKFWLGCFPPAADVYTMDGLHPKALTSKICNDVLGTNINVSSANPNDKLLCFEVIGVLENKLIKAGIVAPPEQKPGGTAHQKVYQRVSHADFNKIHRVLQGRSLEDWARDAVTESIERLQLNPKVRPRQAV